jgi:hypothetical protein
MGECSEIGELELSSLTIPSTTSLTCIICPELHTSLLLCSSVITIAQNAPYCPLFLPILPDNVYLPPSQSSSSSGISKVSVDQRRLHDEANERKDFEEERFVRLVRKGIHSLISSRPA